MLTACLIFRQRITALKAVLCVTTLSGSVMVMQPTFIFGSRHETPAAAETVTLSEVHNATTSLGSTGGSQHDYMLGMTACLVAAVSSAMANVLSATSKGCPMSVIMVVGGFGTLLLALVCPLLGDLFPNR